MLLSKIVKAKSSKYYKDLGYNIDEKYININIEDLPKGSNSIVEASCDYCGNIKELSYKNYNKNISINGKFSCSIKCGCLKAKETNLEKWGVESTNQLDSVKEKTRKTVLEKWGVEHISKSKEISSIKSDKMKERSADISNRIKEWNNNLSIEDREEINKKRSNTILEKWGKDNISKVESVKEKVKNTVDNKWGGYTLQSDYLKGKVKITNLEKWGYEIPSKSEKVKEKMYKTNIERWGFKSPSMNDSVKEKVKYSFLDKYNVVNIMYSEEFRKKFNISNELGYISYIGNRNYQFKCVECGSIYDIDYDNYYKRKLRNTNTCTSCFPILENSSIKEVELRNYIKSIYDGEILSSYRDGLEIDIYLPDLKIGFEFNGIYWHSEDKLDKNYHLNKLNYFKERDIRVVNIWEDDWDYKRDIVKSQIKNLLLLSDEKIWARKCQIREVVEKNIVRDFLNDNHIQGYIRSSIKIGLYYGDELVSLMTFDNSEGRNKMEEGGWNLSRFCSKLNINVIGGASKLLNYFIKIYKPQRIISFADLDWSTGELYHRLGFVLKNTLKPDYKLIVDKRRVNKQRFTKDKLIKLGYDSNLTGDKIIESMGISKIYNCGQLKFEIIIKQRD